VKDMKRYCHFEVRMSFDIYKLIYIVSYKTSNIDNKFGILKYRLKILSNNSSDDDEDDDDGGGSSSSSSSNNNNNMMMIMSMG
jgi:hypothetical protein